MPPVTERITADSLTPGDRFRYLYFGKSEGFATVSTVDIRPSIRPDFPDRVELQLEHPNRGRIACLLFSDTEVEAIVKPRVTSRTVQPTPPAKTARKRRLVPPKSLQPAQPATNPLKRFFNSLGIQPKDDTENAAPAVLSKRKPTIKRKRR